MNCPRPKIGNRRSPIRVLGVDSRQFFFCLSLNIRPDSTQLSSTAWPKTRYILKHDLENQTCNRVQIARKSFATESQCLKRNCSPSCKRVHYKGRFFSMSRPYERSAYLDIDGVCSTFPVRKIADKLQQGPAQVFIC